MGILSCLHISDLHIGEINNAGVESFYTQICNDVKNNQQKIDCVVFSGDIVWGHSDDKDKLLAGAVKFFKKLLERINKTLICNKVLSDEDFIFVPGNHDILREDTDDIYFWYREFLKKFYGEDLYKKLYNQKYLYTLRVDKEKKIAIVGLNSCTLEKTISERDRKWIEQLSLNVKGITPVTERKVKEILIANKEGIDDYGEISVEQLDGAFDELSEEIGNFNEYRIVAVFHHHIYPFPEVYSKYGDSSMIRNFAIVIDYFLHRNVSVILHGHKHTSISRPITTNKFYNDPKKIIHVFSAGSIGSDRGSKSYQIVDIHSINDAIDVQSTKYVYEGIEFQSTESITFPPKETNLVATFNILDTLKAISYDLYDQYTNQVLLKDKKSEQYNVRVIINDISNTITTFKNIRDLLERQREVIFILLLIIHYRILVHDGNGNKKMLEHIKAIFKNIPSIDDDYADDIFDLLQTVRSSIYLKKYKIIQENIDYSKYKKETSFIIAITHLLDLYLSLGFYGEIYFKREGIQSKVNFKLEDEIFNESLPTPFLRIAGEEDRRTAIVSFKCLNPTVHKTAVLIVKDFEERISKIEDCFKEIGLKIYYFRPKVTPDGYELENYSFEAYIPKLLPLLTGEHLYKQKEVFVRELIQNSLDAILLREKLDSLDFQKDILITIGQLEKDGKSTKYLKIQDFGVGMDQYKIERYFTSIGRSFYTSDDYAELLQEKKINFKAVSNFGIGFLSVFMVCSAVKVLTKSYDKEKDAIEMEIPNYEGCFFVKKNNTISTVGTEITLFEGDRKKINHKQVIKYLKENLLNVDLNISLKNEIENENIFIEKNKLLKLLIKTKSDFLFVPMNDNGLIDISYDEMLKNIENYRYGIMICLNGNGKSILMNSGIKVTATRTKGLRIGINDDFFSSNEPFDLYYFFPSSFVQLDVSRERILSFKSKERDSSIHKNANNILNAQARDLIRSLKQKKSTQKLSVITNIYYLLGCHPIIKDEMFWISLSLNKDNDIQLSFVSEIESHNTDCFYVAIDEYKNIDIFIDILPGIAKNVSLKNKRNSKNIKMEIPRDWNKENFQILAPESIWPDSLESFYITGLFIENTEEELTNELKFYVKQLASRLLINHLKDETDYLKFNKISKDSLSRFYRSCCSVITFGDIGKTFFIKLNN